MASSSTLPPVQKLVVPGVGEIEATLINAGNPTVFVDAAALGLAGTELQADINGDRIADAVVADSVNNLLRVYLGNSSSSFT